MNKQLLTLLIFTTLLVFVFGWVVNRFFGGMIWPVKGRITSPFGNRVHPISGTVQFHNGVDIAAVTGTPIKAPFSGTITRIFYAEKGGKQMVMKLNNGFTAGFAHLDSYSVKEGQKVNKGQIIGTTGSTGKVTGPHLHLTMRDAAGNYVDPLKHLSA